MPRTKVREKLSQESLEKLSLESFPKQQPPLDAYLASSITDEPAQLSQIEAALASTDNLDPVDQGSRRRQLGKLFTHQYRSKHLQRRDPQSVASSRSSVATASTISSLSSYRSDMSSASRGRRRGRKRFAASTKPSDVDAPKHGFYCTFCWKSFKNKYEWKRHESTVHIPHHSWVCCLSRSPVVGSCPFCGIPNPSFAHIESHDYLTCLEKPEESRTFYRKDQFFKHIINTHCRGRPEDDNGAMEPTEPASEQWLQLLSAAWYKKMPPLRDDDPNLHCGFCGLWFHEWSHRCEHIAEHYAKTQGIKGSYGKLDWWPERKPAFTTTGRYPGQCLVCANSLASPSSHFLRTAWSCSFLRSHLSILEDYAPGLQRCMLCHWIMEAEDAEFHHETHRHRGCKQEIFHSCEHMIEHLNDFHNAKLDNDQFWCFGESVRIRYSGYICAADPGFAEIEAKAVLP